MPVPSVPPELVVMMLSLLPVSDLLSARRVCKSWLKTIDEDKALLHLTFRGAEKPGPVLVSGDDEARCLTTDVDLVHALPSDGSVVIAREVLGYTPRQHMTDFYPVRINIEILTCTAGKQIAIGVDDDGNLELYRYDDEIILPENCGKENLCTYCEMERNRQPSAVHAVFKNNILPAEGSVWRDMFLSQPPADFIEMHIAFPPKDDPQPKDQVLRLSNTEGVKMKDVCRSIEKVEAATGHKVDLEFVLFQDVCAFVPSEENLKSMVGVTKEVVCKQKVQIPKTRHSIPLQELDADDSGEETEIE